MPGMRTSMITTSGLRRRASSMALAPSPASPTMRMCGARESESRSPSRTTSWSSTMSAVISSGIRPILGGRQEGQLLRDGGAACPAPPTVAYSGGSGELADALAHRLGVRLRHVRAPAVEAFVLRQELRPVAREAFEEVLARARLQVEDVRPDAAGAGLARGADDLGELLGSV